jgi:hypothetical protein
VSTLAVFVLPIGIVVGLGVVVGLGCLVHRRPALKTPVTVALTAAGVLVASAVAVMGVAQASSQGGGVVTVAPARR